MLQSALKGLLWPAGSGSLFPTRTQVMVTDVLLPISSLASRFNCIMEFGFSLHLELFHVCQILLSSLPLGVPTPTRFSGCNSGLA